MDFIPIPNFDSSVQSVSIVFQQKRLTTVDYFLWQNQLAMNLMHYCETANKFSVKRQTVPQFDIQFPFQLIRGGRTVSGGGSFAVNSEVTITAAPNSGYKFTNWTENDTVVSTESSYTFTVTVGRTFTANFEVDDTPFTPITVSFRKPADWGDTPVYLWAWTEGQDGQSLLGVDWPGIPISEGENGFSSFTFGLSIQSINVIFSKSGSPQSDNIENVVTSTCYELDSYYETTNKFSVKQQIVLHLIILFQFQPIHWKAGTVSGGGSFAEI